MIQLNKREYTQDVYFNQCSLNQVFYWQGHCYKKLPENFAEKRTNDFGQQIDGKGLEVMFHPLEVVVISNDDVHNLRSGS